jgi:hypothetical protein
MDPTRATIRAILQEALPTEVAVQVKHKHYGLWFETDYGEARLHALQDGNYELSWIKAKQPGAYVVMMFAMLYWITSLARKHNYPFGAIYRDKGVSDDAKRAATRFWERFNHLVGAEAKDHVTQDGEGNVVPGIADGLFLRKRPPIEFTYTGPLGDPSQDDSVPTYRPKRAVEDYVDIGHEDGSNDAWSLNVDADDIKYASARGIPPDAFHNVWGDEELRGRVDHITKQISIATIRSDDPERIKYAKSILLMDNPGYEVWLFGERSQPRRID